MHGLHDVAEGRLLVAEFVQIAVAPAAESCGGDLAGDRQHGRGGGGRLLERGQRGQGAGPGGEEQGRHLAGDPAVGVGGEARVVLDAQSDVGEGGAAQRVEHAERVLAGQPEDGGGAESLEGLDDQVAAVASGRRVQGRLGLRGGELRPVVVVVTHLVRPSAIWRDMIVVSSYAVCEAATDVISA